MAPSKKKKKKLVISTLMSKNKSTPQTPLKLQCILKIKKIIIIMLTCNVYRSILMSIDNNNLVDNYPP